ncbi:hypothetical protein LTR12_010995 [Friedmanniomyces endolithicus]|nr:hypothetical protein LTR12_010995 [Friedmanniomyces endolithicus]
MPANEYYHQLDVPTLRVIAKRNHPDEKFPQGTKALLIEALVAADAVKWPHLKALRSARRRATDSFIVLVVAAVTWYVAELVYETFVNYDKMDIPTLAAHGTMKFYFRCVALFLGGAAVLNRCLP